MEKNSPITAEQLNALLDVTSFMKNVSSAFEKIKTSLLFEPGAFYHNLETLITLIESFCSTNTKSAWIPAMKSFSNELHTRFIIVEKAELQPLMMIHLLDLNHRCTRLFNDEMFKYLKCLIKDKIVSLKNDEDESSSTEDGTTRTSEYDQAYCATQSYSSDMESMISIEVDAFFKWKKARLMTSNLNPSRLKAIGGNISSSFSLGETLNNIC